MKRVFLLLVFFSCIYAHAQNFYISGGLGLRIEPFKDVYEELHVNPNFVKNIGIGYRFKNKRFVEIKYEHYKFSGVLSHTHPRLPLSYPWPSEFVFNNYSVDFGIRKGRFSPSISLLFFTREDHVIPFAERIGLLSFTPRIAYTWFENDTFSIQSNFTPIGRNLRFNPSLVVSMQYHL
ncbi:hypothetical protein N9H19_01275 [Flavobacteriales bacterium]|nr:hypothetical protein [Flavobacteriales bacterium]